MTVAAAAASLQPLIGTVERSQLLGPDHLMDFRQWCVASPSATPEDAAAWLIDQGWTTRWQAQQLVAGHHSFFLRHYKLVSRLGGGGMGTVFQAIDDRTGRLVAVKVIRKSAMQRPNAIERFKREIVALSKLRHPNIVAAYEAGQLGQYHYLVMEYIEGRDIGYWVAKLKRLPIEMACEIARQSALGLDHAHKLGFLHRDIKPSNLIAVRKTDGLLDVRILDFGLARAYEGNPDEARVTRTGQIVGTVDYLAPEQAQGSSKVDGRSDVYALGVTLFEMISGRTPFTGDSMMARLVARVMEPAPPLSAFVPEAPPALVDAIAKALAFRPDDRFASAGEFAEALGQVKLGAAADAAKASASTAAMSAVSAIETTATQDRTPESAAPVYDEFQQALADKAKGSSDSQTFAIPQWIQKRRYWIAAAAGFALVALIIVMVVAGRKPAAATPSEAGVVANQPDPKLERLGRDASALRERPDAARIQQLWKDLWALTTEQQSPATRTAAREMTATAPHPLEGTFSSGEEQRTVYKPGFLESWGAGKRIKKLAFSPDGRTLASLGGNAIHLHDLIADATSELTTDDLSSPVCLAFSPSGDLLAVGAQDGSIHLFEMNRREWLRFFSGPGAASTVAFLQDGAHVVSTHSHNKVVLWTLTSGQPIERSFDVPHAPITLSIIPRGDSVLLGSWDGRTTVLDLKTGTQETNHPFKTPVVGAEYPPDGNQVFALGAEGICWAIDGAKYTQCWSFTATTSAAKWVGGWSSPWVQRLLVLSAGGEIQLRSWKTGAIEWKRDLLPGVRQANAFAVTPDGRFAAVQAGDGSIELVKLPPITTH